MAQERIFGTGSRREEEPETPGPVDPPVSGAAQAQRDTQGTDDLLAEIEADTGLVPLDLPMQQAFRIDLGFPLGDIR